MVILGRATAKSLKTAKQLETDVMARVTRLYRVTVVTMLGRWHSITTTIYISITVTVVVTVTVPRVSSFTAGETEFRSAAASLKGSVLEATRLVTLPVLLQSLKLETAVILPATVSPMAGVHMLELPLITGLLLN